MYPDTLFYNRPCREGKVAYSPEQLVNMNKYRLVTGWQTHIEHNVAIYEATNWGLSGIVVRHNPDTDRFEVIDEDEYIHDLTENVWSGKYKQDKEN